MKIMTEKERNLIRTYERMIVENIELMEKHPTIKHIFEVSNKDISFKINKIMMPYIEDLIINGSPNFEFVKEEEKQDNNEELKQKIKELKEKVKLFQEKVEELEYEIKTNI